MYHNHPVRIDIAGTVESISEITAEKLYDCYNSFYNLHNMVLCVAGNVTPEQVIAVADKVLKPNKEQTVENIFDDEPYEVAQEYIGHKFPVSIPMFTLGFKQNAGKGAKSAKELAYMNILMDIFSSSSSRLYNEMLTEGLINDTFAYEYMEGPGYAAILFGGESRKPKEAAQRIKESIVKFKENGIDTQEFEIARRAVYGTAVRSFNSNEKIANNMVDMHFNNRKLFDYIDACANASVSDIEKSLEEMLDPNNCTLSVVCSEEHNI